MKETPIFEEVFVRFFRQQGITVKLLIGGLLSFIPIVNILAFGYLYRYSASLRRSGSLNLPEWGDWKELFMDGLRFAVAWLAYWLLPVLIATALSGMLEAIHLGAFAYLILMSVFLVAPVVFSAALYRLQMRQQFKDLLDVALNVRMSYAFRMRLLIPALVLFAIGTLLLPLFGFAFFTGFLILVAYTTLCFRSIERA